MVGIANRHLERVAENRGGFHEVNAVLLEIGRRLLRIPLEFHHQSLPSSVQIGITPGFSRGGTKCLHAPPSAATQHDRAITPARRNSLVLPHIPQE